MLNFDKVFRFWKLFSCRLFVNIASFRRVDIFTLYRTNNKLNIDNMDWLEELAPVKKISYKFPHCSQMFSILKELIMQKQSHKTQKLIRCPICQYTGSCRNHYFNPALYRRSLFGKLKMKISSLRHLSFGRQGMTCDLSCVAYYKAYIKIFFIK